MNTLANHLQFVNENIDFQEKSVARLATHPSKQKFHAELLEKYKALRDYLIEQDKARLELQRTPSNYPSAAPKQLKLSLTPDDLAGLPEELVKQLSISDGDKIDFAILNLLEESGGIASLDQLLIGIYKKTNEILKRQALTSRLYRMGQRELIWNVPGKKGVYSNREFTEAEVLSLMSEGKL